jgi:hypothetical protein
MKNIAVYLSLLGLLLAGCTAPLATATPTAILPTAAPTTPPPTTPTPIAVDLSPAQIRAVEALAADLNVSIDQIQLASTEAVDWPDGCLGIVQPDVFCTEQIVPGFRIVLSASGQSYEYRTNQDGSIVLPASRESAHIAAAMFTSDNTVQVVDTGAAADPAAPATAGALMPMGGAAGGDIYALVSMNTQLEAVVVDSGGTRPLDFIQSPDFDLAVWPGSGAEGPRLAWSELAIGAVDTRLFTASTDGSGKTALLVESIADPEQHHVIVHAWSTDGGSLYFSREPYGIGGYILFSGASSLYRLNVSDQSVTELIPFDIPGGVFICLDDLFEQASLVADHCTEGRITVRDLTSGQTSEIQPPAEVTEAGALGSARFSPNGSQVAFALARRNPEGEQGWVAVSDGLGGGSRLIATSEPGQYFTVAGWLNSNTLLIQLNSLQCTPLCQSSLWSIGVDGSGMTRLGEGVFLALVPPSP